MDFLLNIFAQNGEKMVENSTNEERNRLGESHLPINKQSVLENKLVGIGFNVIAEANFTVQAQKRDIKIITLKPGCTIKYNGWFSSSEHLIDDNFNHMAHVDLYNYLYKKNIIHVKLHTLENFFAVNVFNADNIHEINKDLITKDPIVTEKNLTDIINPSNSDYPQLLTCYDINYAELSKFLMEYKYSPIDEIPIGPFGGRKQRRNKTRRKNKTKRQINKKKRRPT
jgi:hypothetical protein